MSLNGNRQRVRNQPLGYSSLMEPEKKRQDWESRIRLSDYPSTSYETDYVMSDKNQHEREVPKADKT